MLVKRGSVANVCFDEPDLGRISFDYPIAPQLVHVAVHMLTADEWHSWYIHIMYTAYCRRIKAEEKTEVVRCCLGTELISISCRARYFAQGRFEERYDFILFFISS